MMEMIMVSAFQAFLGTIGLPGIVAIGAALIFGWRLIKDTSKPVLAVALLALLVFAGFYFRPPVTPEPTTTPGGATSALTITRPARPAPLPPPPAKAEGSYAKNHARGIASLKGEREAIVKKMPDYLDPVKRAERQEARLAKEFARRRKAARLTKAEERRRQAEDDRRLSAASSPRPFLTPDQARAQAFDMQDARIAQAQARLGGGPRYQSQQTPPFIGGLDHARRWR